MGKGGHNVAASEGDTPLSWEEVKKHKQRDDKWLVIDGQAYDITEWSKRHPGGSRVISHYAGQDATEAFRAFHNDPNFVRRYMKPLHLGSVKSEQAVKPPGVDNYQEGDMQEDFEKLRQTVTTMGLFKPSICFFILNVGHLIVLEILAYLILYNFGTSWTPYLCSVLCYTIVQAQAGWVQHDFGHLSVFKSTSLNHWLHQWTMCFTKGASCDWWNHLHYQHHAKPNVMDKDPDVRLEALFVMGETQPKRAAQSNKLTMPYNWQQHYFFAIGPPLLFPMYFQYMIFKHSISRKKWLDVFVMCLFYLKIGLLYTPFLGVWGAMKYYFIVRCLESHWFVWVSQSNHIPMEISAEKERSWVPLQLHATCNVEKGYFNDWFTGHLNFQIEHHLFPTMPRHNLYKAAPLCKSLCEKYGVPYQVKSLSGAFGDIVRTLKNSGEIWYSYYNAHHHS